MVVWTASVVPRMSVSLMAAVDVVEVVVVVVDVVEVVVVDEVLVDA